MTSIGVSYTGLAPVPDEDSQRKETVQDATWHPAMSKHVDQDVVDDQTCVNLISGRWSRDVEKEINAHNEEIFKLVESLGGSRGGYARDRSQSMKRMVSEIYSPPRVTDAARLLPGLGVIPGFAFDLTQCDEHGNRWDFNNVDMRRKARSIVNEEKPQLLIGSPECRLFSTWQYINDKHRDPEVVKKERLQAMVHIAFCCQLYEDQINGGRYFLHEHPAWATSWKEQCVRRLWKFTGVDRVVCDQCQLGADDGKGNPLMKPTGFLSNSPELLKELDRRCGSAHGMCTRPSGGKHAVCSGLVARRAATYPFKLCKAILTGFRKQLVTDGIVRDGSVGMHYIGEAERDDRRNQAACGEILSIGHAGMSKSGVKYFDDLTKQPLREDLVREAISKELDYFDQKDVWVLVPMEEAKRTTGRPPITVRWVHVNKGDDDVPNLRARLVAREMRGAGEEAIFAPTPPLEGLRTVLSLAATQLPTSPVQCRDPKSEMRIQVSLIDISRAYFNAKVSEKDPTFVMLPPEHPKHGQGLCAKLLKHMYGTRRAAEGWQDEYSKTLVAIGFVQGLASPCMFHHPERGLVTSVHGDDFTTVGPKMHLDWFETALEAAYELRKGGRLGPGEKDEKEGLILNRVVRWTNEGLEYEADPRQVEKLLKEMQLEGTNTCATPGVKALPEQVAEDKPLPTSEHTKFRGTSARGNYLAADRPDCQFAAKEICRWMAAPSDLSNAQLKRMIRYLNGRRRLVFRYPFQEAGGIECYSDTDWSGCVRTRKSTSGGCLMLGGHVLKTWSSTQPTISLSSGEAEFYGVVRAAGLALGQQSLMRDLGHELPVRVWTDSSAAIGISSRQGLGKLRHIATHTLWVQHAVRSGMIQLRKVWGEVNPADLFTKHLSSRERVTNLTQLFGCEFRDGRPKSAPKLREDNVNMVGKAMGEIDRGGDQEEGERHDERMLPHEYKDVDIEHMFPEAKLTEEPVEETEPDQSWEGYRSPEIIRRLATGLTPTTPTTPTMPTAVPTTAAATAGSKLPRRLSPTTIAPSTISAISTTFSTSCTIPVISTSSTVSTTSSCLKNAGSSTCTRSSCAPRHVRFGAERILRAATRTSRAC